MALNFNPSDYDEVMDEILRQIDLDRFTVGGGGIVGEMTSPALDRYDLRGARESQVRRGEGLKALVGELKQLQKKSPGAERRVTRKGIINDFSEIARGRKTSPTKASGGRVQNLDTQKDLMKAFKKLGKSRGVAPLLMLALLGGGAAALGE